MTTTLLLPPGLRWGSIKPISTPQGLGYVWVRLLDTVIKPGLHEICCSGDLEEHKLVTGASSGVCFSIKGGGNLEESLSNILLR